MTFNCCRKLNVENRKLTHLITNLQSLFLAETYVFLPYCEVALFHLWLNSYSSQSPSVYCTQLLTLIKPAALKTTQQSWFLFLIYLLFSNSSPISSWSHKKIQWHALPWLNFTRIHCCHHSQKRRINMSKNNFFSSAQLQHHMCEKSAVCHHSNQLSWISG